MNTQALPPFRQESALMFNEQSITWECELNSDFTYTGFKLLTCAEPLMLPTAA